MSAEEREVMFLRAMRAISMQPGRPLEESKTDPELDLVENFLSMSYDPRPDKTDR